MVLGKTLIHFCCLAIVGLAASGALEALAQDRNQMPREDVIDVPAMADGLLVSNVFQSNMVLQRDKPIAIWGWANPGEEISVTMGDQKQVVKANQDRSWKATLDAMPANSTAQTLTVQGLSLIHISEPTRPY